MGEVAEQDREPHDVHVMEVIPVRTKTYAADAVRWDGSHAMAMQIVGWVVSRSNSKADFHDGGEGPDWIRITSPSGTRCRMDAGEYVVIGEDAWAERLTAEQYADLYEEPDMAVASAQVAGWVMNEVQSEDNDVKGVIDLDLNSCATLSQAINIAVGAASMTWPQVHGEFDEAKARDIACQLEHEVIRRLKPVKPEPPTPGTAYTDDQIHLADDGTPWVKADAARQWVDLARAGEKKFREARERAQMYCRKAIATYGDLAAVHAAEILNRLELQATESGPDLQPEAAGWGPGGPADSRPPLSQITVAHIPGQEPGAPVFLGPSVTTEPATPTLDADPLPYDLLDRRRCLRIMEAEIPLFLDLPPGSQIRSASVSSNPLAVNLIVLNPGFDPVPADAEAPMWFVDRSAFFPTCVEGNRPGRERECVLADGHGTHEAEDGVWPQSLWPQSLHVDRFGHTWEATARDGD